MCLPASCASESSAVNFRRAPPLPAERELVKQTQMSRATVREALRILEVQNLVRVKAGRAGGAFVQRPTHDVDGQLGEHAHPRTGTSNSST